MQILIETNSINKEEKKYIFDVVFSQFLGFNNYKIIFKSDLDCFKIKYAKTYITFPDKLLSKEGIYIQNYVEKIKDFSFNYDNLYYKKIPFFLYEISENYTYKIDIFGSIFYLLSGLEYYDKKFPRDEFNRFDLTKSFIYKNNFHKRPLVNEYIFLLKNILSEIDFSSKNYKLLVSHDIDRLFSNNKTLFEFSRSLFSDLLIRKSLKLFFKRIFSKMFSKLNFANDFDPYNTIDFLCNTSMKFNLNSQFNFMVFRHDNPNILDSKYRIKNNKYYRKIFNKILNSNCKIGIHGSLDSNLSKNKFYSEISVINDILASISEENVNHARQHYLSFNNQYYKNLDDYGITNDSSIGYDAANGFWSSCCYEYPIFDLDSKKQLKVFQYPLIIMDVNLDLTKVNSNTNLNQIQPLMDQVKYYGGNMTFLYHNNYLRTNREKKNYEYLIKILK
jgi:hypothetical protein